MRGSGIPGASMTGSSTAVGCSSHRLIDASDSQSVANMDSKGAVHFNYERESAGEIRTSRFHTEMNTLGLGSALEQKVEREASQRRNSIQASTISDS